jgi:hypothetical protein
LKQHEVCRDQVTVARLRLLSGLPIIFADNLHSLVCFFSDVSPITDYVPFLVTFAIASGESEFLLFRPASER